MTLDELRAWLVQKVCRLYHVRLHRSLSAPPLLVWERAWRDAQGTLMAPPIVRNPLAFRIDFLPLAYRRVQRTGIEFLRSRYWAEPLSSLIGLQRSIIIRYDPRDLSRIWFRKDDGTIVTLSAVAGRVLNGEKTLQPTDAETLRLEASLDQGLAICDRMEEVAARSTRQQRRSTFRKREQSQTAASAIAPPPNRTQVSVEEWE